MFLQRLTIHRTLLPLCAAVIAFRFRHYLLKLYWTLIPWKGWNSHPDPQGGEKLLCCYVLNNSVHGQPESVLQTFEQWVKEPEHGKEWTRVTRNLLEPQKGLFLGEVVARVAPLVVLELGTYCGYSAIRMLQLLPPGGKLYTVEQCREVADMAEEMILVAGFKNMQVLGAETESTRRSLSVKDKKARDKLCKDEERSVLEAWQS
ncbi:transmembrane O-methyltransferase-like isoform X2 [Pleurodeles waltl]|uniref:transmembrane O-methyltransferase-like isoform X2 n=1 Tax=Pleurodeles waltl TaxID=8319 RepID=UPI0037094327